ncbi:MAG TPA: SHOCT domain-containing protein [Acidimicrobiales bacterium]|nr:SHOCT domain-containing protein [Acidimicrobiales bacterium]
MFTSTLIPILADHRGWDDGPGWFVVFPFLWIALVAFLVFAIWRWRRGGPPGRSEPGARSVLGERYARGEISADEYRERLSVLREDDR